MTDSDPATAAEPLTVSVAGLREQIGQDVVVLDRELAEIESLAQQARAEALRHEAKRTATADRLKGLGTSPTPDVAELMELNGQLVTLTKRAALMEAQVEVLDGKAKVLHRYRDRMTGLAEALGPIADAWADSDLGPVILGNGDGDPRFAGGAMAIPPAVSRIVLGAQEDLRREIARAMHDGPAQSLTNIVLQAQIVERLLARDPEEARVEVRQLMSMVQQTLEATKSFIFDVRPMVLDDLGLVPTLRRAARDRGRRAQIPVDFDSLGPDRRLPMELETGLFRLLDETLAAFLAGRPDRLDIRLDWGEQLEARVIAERTDDSAEAGPGDGSAGGAKPDPAGAPGKSDARTGKTSGPTGERAGVPEEMLPALAAMIEDRRVDSSAAAAEAALLAAWVPLSASAWREIHGRAATLGITAELLNGGTEVRLVAQLDAPPEG
jgi:two-component system sensor histidine kinase DegS